MTRKPLLAVQEELLQEMTSSGDPSSLDPTWYDAGSVITFLMGYVYIPVQMRCALGIQPALLSERPSNEV